MSSVAVYDRTEPNLPNTEASVRYYSVRFGSVGSRNTEPNFLEVVGKIWAHFLLINF